MWDRLDARDRVNEEDREEDEGGRIDEEVQWKRMGERVKKSRRKFLIQASAQRIEIRCMAATQTARRKKTSVECPLF